ncbi:MAG: hypothetical protein KatS3mg110_3760 [Pirellulaceae bacterium]|nr:MAG: hypothetical protein KatS3mg110_3760 [Pirellulaceae bacterium]
MWLLVQQSEQPMGQRPPTPLLIRCWCAETCTASIFAGVTVAAEDDPEKTVDAFAAAIDQWHHDLEFYCTYTVPREGPASSFWVQQGLLPGLARTAPQQVP